LHFNAHRYYDASTGRYISQDPLGLAAGFNGYAYAGANPMSSIDPLGLDFFSIGAYGDGELQLGDIFFAPTYYERQLFGLDPSLPDGYVNGVAGFGDAISTVPFTNFSLSRAVRDAAGIGSVDICSGAYRYGGYAGDAFMLLGGGAGAAKSLIKRPGTVFSHFIPARANRRFIRGKINKDYFSWLDNPTGQKIIDSKLNGNYVTPMEHWLTDLHATLKGRKKIEKTWPLSRQLFNRVPQWIPGSWMMSGGATDLVNRQSDCDCG